MAQIKYQFREPLTLKNANKADAQRVGEALAKVADANGGQLKPDAVVREAEQPRHYLHKFFEWDNKAAAEKYRLDQARHLIRCIDIVRDDDDEEPKPAFISIADKGTSYRKLGEVLDSAHLQARALEQAERDFEAYERRLAVFKDICAAIRDARDVIRRRREEMQQPRV